MGSVEKGSLLSGSWLCTHHRRSQEKQLAGEAAGVHQECDGELYHWLYPSDGPPYCLEDHWLLAALFGGLIGLFDRAGASAGSEPEPDLAPVLCFSTA